MATINIEISDEQLSSLGDDIIKSLPTKAIMEIVKNSLDAITIENAKVSKPAMAEIIVSFLDININENITIPNTFGIGCEVILYSNDLQTRYYRCKNIKSAAIMVLMDSKAFKSADITMKEFAMYITAYQIQLESKKLVKELLENSSELANSIASVMPSVPELLTEAIPNVLTSMMLSNLKSAMLQPYMSIDNLEKHIRLAFADHNSMEYARASNKMYNPAAPEIPVNLQLLQTSKLDEVVASIKDQFKTD